jgi:DnaA-homolog protein
MAWQLPLGIGFRVYPSLAGFLPGPNAQALAAVRACVLGRGEPFLFLWGAAGDGKSHLLQGACELAAAAGIPAAYLPLAKPEELEPAICADLEELELVCLDDIDAIAGQPPWEEALFHLFNRLRERGPRLPGGRRPPAPRRAARWACRTCAPAWPPASPSAWSPWTTRPRSNS